MSPTGLEWIIEFFFGTFHHLVSMQEASVTQTLTYSIDTHRPSLVRVLSMVAFLFIHWSLPLSLSLLSHSHTHTSQQHYNTHNHSYKLSLLLSVFLLVSYSFYLTPYYSLSIHHSVVVYFFLSLPLSLTWDRPQTLSAWCPTNTKLMSISAINCRKEAQQGKRSIP